MCVALIRCSGRIPWLISLGPYACEHLTLIVTCPSTVLERMWLTLSLGCRGILASTCRVTIRMVLVRLALLGCTLDTCVVARQILSYPRGARSLIFNLVFGSLAMICITLVDVGLLLPFLVDTKTTALGCIFRALVAQKLRTLWCSSVLGMLIRLVRQLTCSLVGRVRSRPSIADSCIRDRSVWARPTALF